MLTPILFLHQSHHSSSRLFLCCRHNYFWFGVLTYFLLLVKYFELIFLSFSVHLQLSVPKCSLVLNTQNLRALSAWPIFTYDSIAFLDSKSNQTLPTTLSSIYNHCYHLNRSHSFIFSSYVCIF